MVFVFESSVRIVLGHHDFMELFTGSDPDNFRFAFGSDGFNKFHNIHAGYLGNKELAAHHDIKAFKNNVNFGFWRGTDIQDPKGLLQGSGDKMRHVKVTSLGDIDVNAFTDFVHQAVELNQAKGDPTEGN